MGLPRRRARAWLVIALIEAACTGPSLSASRRPVLRAGPEERERAACLAGRYPVFLDASALAWARYEDVHAQQTQAWSDFAAARLLDERAEFDKRCALWRATATAESQR